MGYESQSIPKSTSVDNVTIETNGDGQIQVKALDSYSNKTTANQTISRGTNADITNGNMTITTAGKYLILAKFKVKNSTTGNIFGTLNIKQNTTIVSSGDWRNTDNSYQHSGTVTLFAFVDVTANDVLKLHASCTDIGGSPHLVVETDTQIQAMRLISN